MRGHAAWACALALPALLAFGPPALAQPATPPSPAYPNQIADDEDRGWLPRQIAQYRVFPHLDRAEQLLRVHKKTEALAEFKQALVASGGRPAIRVRVMILASDTGDLGEAMVQADTLLGRYPRLVPALLYRAFCLQKLGRGLEALDDFERVANHESARGADRTLALRSWADGAIQLGRPDRARPALDSLWTRQRSHTLAMKRARVFSQLDLREETTVAFSQALELAISKPQRVEALAALVAQAEKTGDLPAAQRWAERELAEDPGVLSAQRKVAFLATRNRDVATILRLAPLYCTQAHPFAEVEVLTGFLQSERRYAEADRVLERWLAAHPQDPDRPRALLLLAHTRRAHGRDEASLTALHRAALLSPDADTYLAMAKLQDQLGRPARAVTLLQEGLRRRPSAPLHLELGLREELSKPEAIRHLEAALAKGLPTTQELLAHRALGYRLRDTGDHQRAIEAVARALRTYPDDPELHRMQATNHMDRAQYGEAITHLGWNVQRSPDPENRYPLAVALAANRNDSLALTMMQGLLEVPGARFASSTLWLNIGHLHQRMNQPELAGEAFEKAFTLAKTGDPEWLLMAGNNLIAAHKETRAHEVLVRVLSAPGATRDHLARAHEALGVLESQRAHPAQAAGHFTQAIAHGRPSGGLKISLSRCYEQQKNYPEAIRHMQEGLVAQPALDGVSRSKLERQLALLHLAAHDPGSAAKVMRASLDRRHDPESQLTWAVALRLAGKNDEALHGLSTIEPKALPANLELERLDELSRLFAEKGRSGSAARVIEMALRLQKTPERLYRYAVQLRRNQTPAQAVPPLLEAIAQEPGNQLFRDELAMALLQAGSDRDAIALMEAGLAATSQQATVHAQLGYLYKQIGANRKAADHFRAAIDRLTTDGQPSPDQARRLHDYRGEVSELTRVLDMVAYSTFTNAQGTRAGSWGQPESLALRSSGGLELAWQPPIIGYRRGRRLQLYGRSLWGATPGSLAPEKRSWQLAAGLRYQPFASQNLFLAGERLFKVGEDAMDNWLLRLQHGIGTGQGLVYGRPLYDHTSFYWELDGFVGRPRLAALNLHLRQGLTCNLANRILVTPHAVGLANLFWPDTQKGSTMEFGVGLSLSLLLSDSRYQIRRARFDFTAQYRFGHLLAKDVQGDRDYRGIFFTGVFRL